MGCVPGMGRPEAPKVTIYGEGCVPGARKDPRYGMRARDGGPGSPKGHHLWGGPRARSTKGPQIWDACPGWGAWFSQRSPSMGRAACQEHERTPDMGRGPGMGRPGFPKVRGCARFRVNGQKPQITSGAFFRFAHWLSGRAACDFVPGVPGKSTQNQPDNRK